MTIDDAWLAGLFEGEGCIYNGTHRKNGKEYPTWQLHISSTDEDVILRARAVSGAGTVHGPRTDPKHPDRKPYWTWHVTRRQEVHDVLARLRPQLGARRGAKADLFFRALANLV